MSQYDEQVGPMQNAVLVSCDPSYGPLVLDTAGFLGEQQLPAEADPDGKDPHEIGSKLDAGKPRMSLVLGGFARALMEVVKVGTDGAIKYTENGWMEVPNGVERYTDAHLRHLFKEWMGEPIDQDSKRLHAAHEAWNALARLDLIIRQDEQTVT